MNKLTSFSSKIIISFLFFGLFVSLITSYEFVQKLDNSYIENMKDKSIIELRNKTDFFNATINRNIHILKILIDDESIRNINLDTNLAIAQQMLLSAAKVSKEIFQIRYIDKDGNEIIKINRDANSQTPYIEDRKKLQNKKHRYYFKEIAKKGLYEKWISKLDLNIEYGKIERPLRGTIRIGTPLIIDDKFSGMIIINLEMNTILDKIRQSSNFNVYIIDQDGEFILYKKPSQDWSRYLKTGFTIKDEIPDKFQRLLGDKKYHCEEGCVHSNILFNNQDSKEVLKLILKSKNEIDDYRNDVLEFTLYLTIAILPLGFILAVILTIEPRRIQKDLKKSKTELEEQIEEEIRSRTESDYRYRLLFEGSTDCFIITSLDDKNRCFNNITEISHAVEMIFGYKKDEIINTNFIDLICGTSYMNEKDLYDRFEITDLFLLEMKLKHKSDRELICEVSFEIRRDDDSSNIVFITVRDITEKVRLERDKKEKDDMLVQQTKMAAIGEMMGNIAHQWRQPINALSLVLNKILVQHQMGKLTEEKMTKNIEQGLLIIDKMSGTIDDFRNFFTPNKKKTTFNIEKSIKDALRIVEEILKSKNIQVDMSLEDGIYIKGFQSEFSQVILNLISNAKDVIIEKEISEGKISIKSYSEPTKAIIEVSDNGGGIPIDVIEKIFNPYFTTKEEGKGTGVGLYMSKMIIDKNMDGLLSVKNGENGAIFKIELDF